MCVRKVISLNWNYEFKRENIIFRGILDRQNLDSSSSISPSQVGIFNESVILLLSHLSSTVSFNVDLNLSPSIEHHQVWQG
jgi:hypothetical protein